MRTLSFILFLTLFTVIALDGSELEYDEDFDDNEEPEDAEYSLGSEQEEEYIYEQGQESLSTRLSDYRTHVSKSRFLTLLQELQKFQ